jgi:hypothetical protein
MKKNKETPWFMAIDQYGQHYDGLKHPRKDLMERIGCKHASKMYVDGKDGKAYHVGYVIGRLWLNVYRVIPLRKPLEAFG